MFNYTLYFTIAGSTALVMLIGILLGGWLVFKSKSSVPNETFLGRAPKGEVFSITDGLDEAPYPEEPSKTEEKILDRTNKFLKSLGG